MDLLFIQENKDPDEAPQFIGQEWFNTTSLRWWKAIGTAAASDWTPLNTGESTRIWNQNSGNYQEIQLAGQEAAPQIIFGEGESI